MGRYSVLLARAFVDAVGVGEGMRVLDVGCGPGGMTTDIAARVGQENVAAIDPAPQFANACRARNPGADVRVGVAEELPWEDGAFDAALACLVVAFMSDPDAGLGEMARVTAPGGTVAACMWDIAGGRMNMLRIFWAAMRDVRPDTEAERGRPGTSEGDIAERLGRAGLGNVSAGTLTVAVDYEDFDDLWAPFTFGVGPAGKALAALDNESQAAVREAMRAEVPGGRFSLDASAWYATGTV